MPETSIHKDRKFEFWENKIWFAEYRPITPPARTPPASEQLCEREFRVLVTARAYARHDFRALSGGENIRHMSLLVIPCSLPLIHPLEVGSAIITGCLEEVCMRIPEFTFQFRVCGKNFINITNLKNELGKL
jgi:hypothetical protein